jgi:hypothetical protein
MKSLNWIESTGGPLIIISETNFHKWSGTYDLSSFINGQIVVANDFLSPDQTDYAKACSIDDYLGIIKKENEDVIVLGDEPLKTSAFLISQNELIILRSVYENHELYVEEVFSNINAVHLKEIGCVVEVKIESNKQYLVDSSSHGKQKSELVEKQDFLCLELKPNNYKISTAFYTPTSETKFIIHKVVVT